ncbi:ubiquitinyl hydrolase 1 [Puccinia graminis f. sp. tritici]|uniref:Ubiquitin carboxyl-terminal hydrolase n=1 Tax=Puccinia graminis f. sp. tritici TaxID=56615 RepID=A0A5B0Q0B1_PUCGR|nr:ubiquitinyl hydrolase 1 [Puccinia graminis f. sp. tritici]KAA1126292.1 ubiquitinyl hydrolase 1 [Puccinia graminis f. sp. tritici]
MRWLPLESNPEVMNAWSSALGLSTDQVSFTDVYGLDAELLAMVPKPVYAVLMLFPISKEYEAARAAEHARIVDQAGGAVKSDERLIFIKQTISNACGTIGLLHALANNSEIPITEGPLTKFLEQCRAKSPSERAQLLEDDCAIADVHADQAQSGQSKVPSSDEEVNLHFVCFVKKVAQPDRPEAEPARLVELDGRKAFPIDHGPIAPSQDLLEAVVPVVKQFIQLSQDNVNFNLIALCQNSA